MSFFPAIDGYDYKDIRGCSYINTTSTLKKCDLINCVNMAFYDCSQQKCKFRFCYEHSVHKHFLCQYCKGKPNFARSEIIVDAMLACDPCTKLLIEQRCCKSCCVWMTQERATSCRLCVSCTSLKKCAICCKFKPLKQSCCGLCDGCYMTQQACRTQKISGYFKQF